MKVAREDCTEVSFGRPGRWAVVVGEVDVRDAAVESAKHDVALNRQFAIVAEVVPQSE